MTTDAQSLESSLASDVNANLSSPSKNENESSGSSPSPNSDARRFERELEAAQQKAFQRFTSQLSGLGFRSPFSLNVLPPFLAAALQQQQHPTTPLNLQQQLLGLSAAIAGVSPRLDDDDDGGEDSSPGEGAGGGGGRLEPEDLTIHKDKRLDDGLGDPTESEHSNQQNWSYEEQFKQLYELSDDLKRKEWLDDWLSFMHRIGKPVTRIPIMAKQVLDLYELYRLVVQHGGLVEIINKKLWREITKGLNLPSSITSAAFTLRTQYQKFLYDYECEKEGLSSASDLQQAIDGNRREGRRNASSASFPSLSYSLNHAAPTLLGKHHMNGSISRNNNNNNNGRTDTNSTNSDDHISDDDSGLGSSASAAAQHIVAAYRAEQLAAIEAQQRQFERAQRAAVEAVVSRNPLNCSGRDSTSSIESDVSPAKRIRAGSGATMPGVDDLANATAAMPIIERLFGGVPMPSAHLKITSRGTDVRNSSSTSSDNNSLVVSMEINGIMYQGVLFALNPLTATSNGDRSSGNPLC